MPRWPAPAACWEAQPMEEALINISQINEAINPLMKDWEFVGY